MHTGVMLNAYPDSLGGRLSGSVRFLEKDEARGAFDAFYILPTFYITDMDGGFSVVEYALNPALCRAEDLEALRALKVDLVLDLVLNHLSTRSPEFRDLLEKGEASEYRDFFIDWNRFWEGYGEMTEDGYIQPEPELIANMNFRKPGLPILMVRMPDGRDAPYWNTFYQKILWPRLDAEAVVRLTGCEEAEAKRVCASFEEDQDIDKLDDRVREALWANRSCLGQMDLNVQSPRVWAYYDDTLSHLKAWGVKTVRLDAFVRLHKAVGRPNFMNEPETWDILKRLKTMAEARGLSVLPEIHSPYDTGAYEKLAALDCSGYDYFLPGLIIDAIETRDPTYLVRWIREIIDDGLDTVNMLGCHDGIPIRDLRGLLPEDRRMRLAHTIEARGGRAKLIHGRTTEIYQMCATYLSALGGDVERLLLARAIQVFTPGVNQVWYLDLFCGENDLDALKDGADAREINRTRLSGAAVDVGLRVRGTEEQLALLRLRKTHPAFSEDARVDIEQTGVHSFRIIWTTKKGRAALNVDLDQLRYSIDG